jgi:hypothetical protein
MLCFFPSSTDGFDEVSFGDLFTACEIASCDLGVDLDSRVGRDEVFWNIIAFQNGNATLDDRVVFPAKRDSQPNGRDSHLHIAHGHHVINLDDTQPMQDIGHEGLEPHILHAGDQFCRFKIPISGIATSFSEIVDEVFGDFA